MNYGDSPYVAGLHPFIDFVHEDKSSYPFASTIDKIDDDNDFLIGESGGFLMNWNFIGIGTKAFSDVADNYRTTGIYCSFYPNTIEYNEFWTRETKRRREGMTLNCKLYHKDIDEYFHETTTVKRQQELLHPLHITGDHYNYLNYSRILRSPHPDEKARLIAIKSKKKKIQDFPDYRDGDYWNFKIDEFCFNNGYHLAKSKARRKGYSYKRGSQAANTVNLNTDITVILGAYDIDYLTEKGATTTMVKTNLDWYERQTYWHRGYISEAMEGIHLGYRESKGGNANMGWNSAVISSSLYQNPSALIGKDAVEVDIEEAGKCPNLQEVLNVTLSGTEAGDELSGILRIYGTGGAKDADWAAFSNAFYSPGANGMLPLENVWDQDARLQVCGFFHPQILNYEPFMDEHGNSYLVTSWYIDVKKKNEAKTVKTPHDWNIYCAQRANSPSEAFIIGSTNIFSHPALTEHYKDLVVNKNTIKCRDGMIVDRKGVLRFLSNAELESEGIKTHPFIENVPIEKNDDPMGCIRMFAQPFRIGSQIDGTIPDNLYAVLIDPMGKDIEEKEITIKHSLVSIQVWMLPNTIANSIGNILVASYTGRPETLEEGSKIAMYLTEYYNARCLPETDRGTVVTDFKREGKKEYLMRDPMRVVKDEAWYNIPYGTNIGGGPKADDAIIALKDLLFTKVSVRENGEPVYVLHYIQDIGFIKELLKYNKKGNFDRISAARLYPMFKQAYNYKQMRAEVEEVGETLLGSLNLYGN